MKYLLDTSIYSQPLKKNPIPSVVNRWKEVGDLVCCISVFCEMEVHQGLRLSNSSSLLLLYESVLKDRIPILPFTLEEAEIYAELQANFVRSGKTRPVIDLCIASTALSSDCILVTLNAKDFTNIPGLRVENWGNQ
jgi:tRNA(fMet)-specific endonuclease VapC